MAYNFGLTGKLFRATASENPNPADTAIDNVRDVTLNLTSVEADTTSRASITYKSSKVILLDASLSFEMLDEESDAHLDAIQTAFFSKGAIGLFPTDHVLGQGLDANWNITSFTRNEPLEGVISYNVEAKPNNELKEPIWRDLTVA